MMKAVFDVFHTMAGETVATIYMDIELVRNPEIVDQNNLSLNPIANGGVYTLLPQDDPRITILRAVRQVHHNLTARPASLFSTNIGRVDTLIQTVGRLFEDVEYISVESKEDLAAIINPKENHEPKIIKISVLGDLAKEILDESKQEQLIDTNESTD